jgi:hypothetical protein
MFVDLQTSLVPLEGQVVECDHATVFKGSLLSAVTCSWIVFCRDESGTSHVRSRIARPLALA